MDKNDLEEVFYRTINLAEREGWSWGEIKNKWYLSPPAESEEAMYTARFEQIPYQGKVVMVPHYYFYQYK